MQRWEWLWLCVYSKWLKMILPAALSVTGGTWRHRFDRSAVPLLYWWMCLEFSGSRCCPSRWHLEDLLFEPGWVTWLGCRWTFIQIRPKWVDPVCSQVLWRLMDRSRQDHQVLTSPLGTNRLTTGMFHNPLQKDVTWWQRGAAACLAAEHCGRRWGCKLCCAAADQRLLSHECCFVIFSRRQLGDNYCQAAWVGPLVISS